jgi:hypothetical protein
MCVRVRQIARIPLECTKHTVVGRDLDEGERHFEHLLAHDVSADKKRLLQAFRLHLEQLGNEGNSCADDGRRPRRINPPLVRSAWQRST